MITGNADNQLPTTKQVNTELEKIENELAGVNALADKLITESK